MIKKKNLLIMITCTKRLRCKYNTPTPIWSGRTAQDTKDGRKKTI